MDLNRLEEFTVIAKHLSIKKAAEELHVSAATLSSRLNNFEKSLGTPLFYRTSGGLTISPSGQRILNDALHLTHSVRLLKDELQNTSSTELHQLRIMVVGMGLPFYLGPFLDITSKNNPHLQLEIVDDNYCSMEDGLRNNIIDVAFAPTMSHIPMEGIIRRELATAHQYILLPQSHPLAEATTISFKDLENETFVIYPRRAENALRRFQLENLEKSGIRYHTYESETSASFYQLLVPIGKGLILSPFLSLTELPNSRSIPIRDIVHPAPSAIHYAKDNITPEAKQFAQDFLKFVKEVSSHDNRKTL